MSGLEKTELILVITILDFLILFLYLLHMLLFLAILVVHNHTIIYNHT